MRFRDQREGLKLRRCNICKGRRVLKEALLGTRIILVRWIGADFHAHDTCRCNMVDKRKPGKRQRRRRRA